MALIVFSKDVFLELKLMAAGSGFVYFHIQPGLPKEILSMKKIKSKTYISL